MHLVGYLYEEYHVARSLEHKDIRSFANAPKMLVVCCGA